MSSSTKDVDKGYKALIKQLKLIEKNPYVKVGLLKDEKSEDGGSLAVIAASNEYGTDDGRIPERSYMRSTADKHGKNLNRMIDKGYDKIIKQKMTVHQLLNRVGLRAASLMQETITKLKTPALAASTIKAKGSSNPLVDQGQLRGSMRHGVVMDGKNSKGST